jgi:glycyl-tRNA synthetase beta chain
VAPVVAPELLREGPERALQETLEAARAPLHGLLGQRQYERALDLLAGLRPTVDHFFEHVLVNDPDAALRANRLALLAQLRALFLDIADLSRLPGTA